MKTPFKIKRLTSSAIIPTRAYEGDLGYDLYADEDVVLKPLEAIKIKTGIAVQFPEGWGGFIKERSSMAAMRTIVSGGVIDNAYRGELSIIMTYINEACDGGIFFIQKGDKIAQLVPIPVSDWQIKEVDDFDNVTVRAERGFGSSN